MACMVLLADVVVVYLLHAYLLPKRSDDMLLLGNSFHW